MSDQTAPRGLGHYEEFSAPARTAPRIPIAAFGMSLGLFLAIAFLLCVLFDLQFPDHAMYQSWQNLLPGFTWLSWPSFFLGLAESFGYGWFVAIIFGPLFNFFAARRS